jgi:hypothetical protein
MEEKLFNLIKVIIAVGLSYVIGFWTAWRLRIKS